MEIYNYLDQETQDVINYFKNELSTEEQQQYLQEDEEDFIDSLNSHLFNEDRVTGNGSGSYTFNTLQAEKNLVGNWELLRAAVEELSPNFNAVTRGAEACDVLIRLYLLPEAIQKAFVEGGCKMQEIGGLKLSVFLHFLYTHFINLLRK